MKRLIGPLVLSFFGIISVGSVSLIASATAETLVGSNADNRVTVAFRVAEETLRGWLPAPWQAEPVPTGPFKGANLLVAFIDRLLNQDAEGRPAGGGTFRLAALYVPARHPQTRQSAPFIVRVYGPHEGAGPYRNSVRAMVSREATQKGMGFEPGAGSEYWRVRDSDGGMLEFRMEYQRAVPVRSKGEARPHSNIDPTFFRMYRYDQIMDVVKSIPDGIERVQSHQLRVTISELRGLFNGTEQLLGIALVPWYGRKTVLP